MYCTINNKHYTFTAINPHKYVFRPGKVGDAVDAKKQRSLDTDFANQSTVTFKNRDHFRRFKKWMKNHVYNMHGWYLYGEYLAISGTPIQNVDYKVDGKLKTLLLLEEDVLWAFGLDYGKILRFTERFLAVESSKEIRLIMAWRIG